MYTSNVEMVNMYRKGYPERTLTIVLHSSKHGNKLAHLFCGQPILRIKKFPTLSVLLSLHGRGPYYILRPFLFGQTISLLGGTLHEGI